VDLDGFLERKASGDGFSRDSSWAGGNNSLHDARARPKIVRNSFMAKKLLHRCICAHARAHMHFLRRVCKHLFTNIVKPARSKRDSRQAKTRVDNLLVQLADEMHSMWNADSFLHRAQELVKKAINEHAKYSTAELDRSRPVKKGAATRRRLGSTVQDGGKSRHAERGASNVQGAGSSRRLERTFTRCNWVEVASA